MRIRILVRLERWRNAGFSRGNLVEENPEGRQQIEASPLEFVDVLLSVRPICEFFGSQNFIPAAGAGDNLKLTLGNIEIDPVARADGSQPAAIESFRNDVRDGDSVVLERNAAVGNEYATGIERM